MANFFVKQVPKTRINTESSLQRSHFKKLEIRVANLALFWYYKNNLFYSPQKRKDLKFICPNTNVELQFRVACCVMSDE
jgi:hypothetical protein